MEVQHAHVVELALAGRPAEDVHAIFHCGGGVSIAAGRQLSCSLQRPPGDSIRVELVDVVQEDAACSLAAEEVEVRAALGEGVPFARRRHGAEHAGLRPAEGIRRQNMQVAEWLGLSIASAEEEDALLHQSHRVVAARGRGGASGARVAPREGVRVEDVQLCPRIERHVSASEDVQLVAHLRTTHRRCRPAAMHCRQGMWSCGAEQHTAHMTLPSSAGGLPALANWLHVAVCMSKVHNSDE